MEMQEFRGLEAVEVATLLLQRMRLEHPSAGVWEAADLQWWWRMERASDAVAHAFWFDGGGPVAGVLFTDWKRSWQCDVLALASVPDETFESVWSEALDRMRELPTASVEVMVCDDDRRMIDLLAAADFVVSEGSGGTTWMQVADRPSVSALATGYRLRDRTELSGQRHHMAGRAGTAVAERLEETSLYRPDLDLFVECESGDIAGYALFWNDPFTKVGFLEPMRVEDAHQGQGLGRHLLTAGLQRLAALGADRVRVNYEVGNEATERLYLGAGFELTSTTSVWVRSYFVVK